MPSPASTDPESLVVVDCETTGFHPSANHRIIELALVELDPSWEPANTWCSLLQPDRDLGATEVHRIRGRDLLEAPRFEDVLGDVLDRLAGRMVVAHNARFDGAFLEHELARAGIEAAPLPVICTMELAARLRIGGARRGLSDCCAAIGAPSGESHTAEADAVACAAILADFVQARGHAELTAYVRGRTRPAAKWPRSERRAPCKSRSRSDQAPSEPAFLETLVQTARTSDGEQTDAGASYLAVLDSALEDRRLTPGERSELADAARLCELGRDEVRRLHRHYLENLVAAALRDGVVTEREREDLVLVAEALGVANLDHLLDGAPVEACGPGEKDDSLAGQSVCFTGALTCTLEETPITRDLARRLAERAGMVVAPRVTKKLDMLVVADPNSRSGKATKAREYGVRIVAETAFWPMIGVEVS
jgi:DNA polymerase-3 subunit epsilon